MTAILLGTLLTFNIFDLIWLLTAGGPSTDPQPAGADLRVCLRSAGSGAAAAASVLMFLMLLVFTLLYFQRRDFKEE